MPPAIHASCSAETWMAGTIAFGTAWRQITVRSDSPFNRAIVTYSDSSTSTIEPRMIRLMYGVTAKTSVAAGSTTTFGSAHAFSPGGNSETAGNQWKTMVANSSTSPMPITNSGSAASTSVVVEPMWSTGRSRFMAIQTPSPIDRGMATNDATKTRNAELATRDDSSSLTGCWVAADSPKEPVITPPIHCRYWLTSE